MKNPTTIRPLLIHGEWASDTGATISSINPANGADNGHVAAATAEVVAQAVRSGREAAADAAWRGLLAHQRGRLLARLADVIASRSGEFAQAQLRENGKPLAECRAQATAAEAIYRYYAAVCETLGAEITPPRGNYLSMTSFEPYGVVAAITPWNSPLTMEAQKVAAAIAAGNAVVLKPSEVTPSCALELGRAALDAGIPPGILNVLPGTGAEAGDALVRHPDVRMVSFTGGTDTGRRIARAATDKLMPVALELGGKSPHIVFADADLDAAAAAVASGIFEGSGQSCVAGSRLFVQRACYDAVVDKVVTHARQLVVGLPDDVGTQMGPLSSFVHRQRIEQFVASARAEGGQILVGGHRPKNTALDAGAYYEATVIAGLPNSAAACQQEIFGPVLCVLPFDDEDDLVAQANDSAYGLAAGIWTSSYPRAWRIAQRLEAGTVWINTYKQLSVATPFGGFKDSGLGREKGIAGMRLYQQQKSLYWGL
jgi:betaine-aldehyde dehydrogenase